MDIEVSPQAEFIINTIKKYGFKAYAVGGCVRDSIMHKKPCDWDICTDAEPLDTENIFKATGLKTLETGLKHGTITVLYGGTAFEVTTFRSDGEYSDNRHPNKVNFVKELEEDLARRDFTVNAMAYNPKDGIIDCFGGINDIEDHILRAVGDPYKRFKEDALRILRCLRFSSVLGFKIEENTSNAVLKLSPLLKNISKERINVEFGKIILGDNAESILLDYASVIAEFIPEIKPMFGFNQHNIHHIYDVWRHSVKTVVSCPKDLTLRLTMLLHDVAKPDCFTIEDDNMGHFYGHAKLSAEKARDILINLKYDNSTVKSVYDLIYYHDIQLNATEKSVKKLLNKLGEEQFYRLLEVKKADTLGINPIYHKERLKFFEEIKDIAEKILSENQCFSIRDLAINGKDIMELGVPKGPRVGKILNELLEMVMEEQIPNDRKIILEYIKETR